MEHKCDFCGKEEKKEVNGMINGPGVFICIDCVELSIDIFVESGKMNALTGSKSDPETIPDWARVEFIKTEPEERPTVINASDWAHDKYLDDEGGDEKYDSQRDMYFWGSDSNKNKALKLNLKQLENHFGSNAVKQCTAPKPKRKKRNIEKKAA